MTEESAPLRCGVINYGAGNLGNLHRALVRLRLPSRILSSPGELRPDDTDILILPGVGAFPPAMELLRRKGWEKALRRWVDAERPLLGICLGMQLLCEASMEDGNTSGLGFLSGVVHPLEGVSKVPHMGWNSITWLPGKENMHALVPSGSFFYFVHSFALRESAHAAATTRLDDLQFPSVVLGGRVAGCQFHPERSGLEGVAFLGRLLAFLRHGVSAPGAGNISARTNNASKHGSTGQGGPT
ncbi:imidazole glycerol phosphate synthase subunit HisH [Aminiphilus circumscriptus]|uniref:imidazole glycerol phosphate synthase subunit HisH n=1 Tax=Aminiphilus circumscriptus TaxID=290732 RepID=UPI000492BBB7|nr:imidazole glycerol phosphate synthase subunit HisH [Aminiphilus circumscriptus]